MFVCNVKCKMDVIPLPYCTNCLLYSPDLAVLVQAGSGGTIALLGSSVEAKSLDLKSFNVIYMGVL